MMEFLKISYMVLEIYLKGENSSTIEEINENSQWIQISKSIIDENPEILDGSLNDFDKKLKKLFIEYSEFIKTHLKNQFNETCLSEFDETCLNKFEICLNEFNNCFVNDNIIIKINDFILKYNYVNEKSDYFGRLYNIITITDYISNHITDVDNMVLIKFKLENDSNE